MIVIKLFFYLISPFILLLILLIHPLIKIRLVSMPSERIGEFVSCFEIYFKKGMKKKNCLDIFFTQKIVSNNFYLYLIKKKIFVIKGVIIFPVYKIISFLALKYIFFKKFILMPFEENKIFGNLDLIYDDEEIITTIPKKFIKKGENFLKNIGISSSDKIILLYVRDASYLKEAFPDKDYSYHNYRDCEITNYVDAIHLAIKKGYYIFRMGAKVEKELKIDNEKFIDYSNLYRNEFLDIYLAYRCSLVIGTPAGYDAVPCLSFKKPILSTNGTPILPLILSPRSKMHFALKHYYNKSKKKYLSIKEIFELNLANKNGPELLQKDIIVHENSKDELKNMVLEFINHCEGKLNLSKENLQIKDKFNNIILDYYLNNHNHQFYISPEYFENTITNNKKDKFNKNVLDNFKNKKKNILRSKISINFLENNLYLIE